MRFDPHHLTRRSVLLFTLLASLAVCHAIPQPQNATALNPRGCKDEGRCIDDYVWSLVAQTNPPMYSCCPKDYIAVTEPDDTLSDLDTFFCCKEGAYNPPCPSDERRMTSTPLECPCGSQALGSSCVGGELESASVNVRNPGLPHIWTVMGSALLLFLI